MAVVYDPASKVNETMFGEYEGACFREFKDYRHYPGASERMSKGYKESGCTVRMRMLSWRE